MAHWIQRIAISVFLLLVSQSVLYAQSEPDHLKVIIGTGQLGNSNTYIAEAEGYFAAQNIENEYVVVSSTTDAEALALLLGGDVDVLQATWTPGLFNAIARGGELKAVAVATYNDPETCAYAGFAVTSGRAENFDVEALRGESVAISNGIGQYYFDRWLEGNGLRLSDVTVENIPGSARVEALANGTVEVSWLTEPTLSRTISELDFELLAGINDISPDSSLSALLFGPTMLNRDDDAGVRFLTAYLQGSRQFNEGPTERNIEILSPALEIEPETLTNTCWISFREDGLLNTDFALDYMNWLNEQDLLDETLELDEFYDPTYVEQAYQRVMAMTEPAATETAAE